ncbi:MAG: hypothetical protein ACK5L0_05385 [Candidatus Fimivivens sp.]
MKRLNKRFSVFCLIVAAIFSLTIGVGFPRIQDFSANTIARMFPVSYQITYRNTDAQPIVASSRFLADTAIISTPAEDMAIPTSDAVFVCLQNELRTQNILRSGLLTALILLVATSFQIALVATILSGQNHKMRNVAKRHPRTAQRYIVSSPHTIPSVPSVA